MGNPFVHVELQTTDVKKAKTFYRKLFDWKLQDMKGEGGYTFIDVGKGTGGGIMKHPMPDQSSTWYPYVLVKDVAATLKKAKTLGAKICLEPHEVKGYGTMGVFVDPTGATLCVWKPAGMK